VYHNNDNWNSDLSTINWVLCSKTFTNFIFDTISSERFDGWYSGLYLAANDQFPDSSVIEQLRQQYHEGPFTDYPDSRMRRFFTNRGIIRIASNTPELVANNLAEWTIDSDSFECLFQLARFCCNFYDLRDRLKAVRSGGAAQKNGEVVWQKNRETINQDSGGLYADPATIFRPTKISFRPDGGYYLGDAYGSHYIFVYDRHDRFVRTLGGFGTEPGKFATPHGHWLDDRDSVPKLVVADRANQRLQWFDMDGQFLNSLGGFLFPADIDVQEEFMLVPDLHARLTILNGQNEVVAQLGDEESWRNEVLADNFAMRGKPARWRPGHFVHPHDARFDVVGNIYVAEWVRTGRVTKLVRKW